MLKIILQKKKQANPFNEPARDLPILIKPLFLHQRDVLSPFATREIERSPNGHFPQLREECLVYRDNLFFNSMPAFWISRNGFARFLGIWLPTAIITL